MAAPPDLESGITDMSYPMPDVRGIGEDELPHAQGQGRQPRRATPLPRSGAAAWRSYPRTEARDGSGEEQPHIQEVADAWAQEGQ